MNDTVSSAPAPNGTQSAHPRERGGLGAVPERVKDKMAEAADTAQDLYGRALEGSRKAAGEMDRVISDQPYAAAAVAAVAGLAIGVLLGLAIADRD